MARRDSPDQVDLDCLTGCGGLIIVGLVALGALWAAGAVWADWTTLRQEVADAMALIGNLFGGRGK